MSCHPNYLAFWSFGRDHLLHLTSDEEEEEEVYDDLVIDDQIKCKNCSDNKNLDENIQQIIGVFGQVVKVSLVVLTREIVSFGRPVN